MIGNSEAIEAYDPLPSREAPPSGQGLVAVEPAGTRDGEDLLSQLVAGWLAACRSEHTRRAYRRDLLGRGPRMRRESWFVWCAGHELHPLVARRGHVDTYARYLESVGAAPATVARILSVVSSFYAYCVDEEVLDRNPAGRVSRPSIDRDTSQTVGLSRQEAIALLTAAHRPAESTRTRALVQVLLATGVRVGELLALDTTDLGHDAGHRTLTVTRKGGRRQKLALPAPAAVAVDACLGERVDGPLFATATGRHLDEAAVFRLVRRLAEAAELPQADRVSPHSLRHTCATLALNAGATLRDVQDMLGHADTRTTRRYDRARHNLDRSPAYLVSATLSH